jgi:pentatricopeptide repeat protein
MRFHPKSTIVFWALLCAPASSLAFSTVSPRDKLVRLDGQVPDVSALAGAHVDGHIRIALKPLPLPFSDVVEQSCFPHVEEYTSILLNEKDHPIGSLPQNVVASALKVLYEWRKMESVKAAEMVEQLIDRLKKEGKQILDHRHYTVAVNAWANSGHENAARKAEMILERMENMATTTDPSVAPSRKTYGIVLHAYIQQNKPHLAEVLLQKMEDTPNMLPSYSDYNELLSAFARNGDARKAEGVLKRLVDLCKEIGSTDYAPDMYMYQRVLAAWASANDPIAGQRSYQILQALIALSDKGELSFQPDERAYSSVISAVVRSSDADRLDQAEGIFHQAIAKGIIPNSYMYVAMMQAYANIGAVEKTEEILRRMEGEGIANTVAYNSVLKAWKGSSAPDAAERAEAIMDQMISSGLANRISFTTVMAAYGNRADLNSAVKADSLLQRMQDLYKQGNEQAKPNLKSYNTSKLEAKHDNHFVKTLAITLTPCALTLSMPPPPSVELLDPMWRSWQGRGTLGKDGGALSEGRTLAGTECYLVHNCYQWLVEVEKSSSPRESRKDIQENDGRLQGGKQICQAKSHHLCQLAQRDCTVKARGGTSAGGGYTF